MTDEPTHQALDRSFLVMLLRSIAGLVLTGVVALTPGAAAQPSPGPRIVKSMAPLVEGGEFFDNNVEYLATVSRESAVLAIAWNPDGRSLAIGTEDGTVHIWEISTGHELIRIQAPPPVESLAFSPDGKRLAVASKQRGVSVWDPSTGNQTLAHLPGNIVAVSYRPDGNTLACGFVEGHIDLWNLQDNTRSSRFKGHTDRVNSMAWNRDGEILASGSWDGTVRLWNPEGREKDRSLRGHDGSVNSVSWDSDSERLASGSSDGTVSVWNIGTGQELVRLEEDPGGVAAVAWSADGNSIVSGHSDHTVRLWNLSSKEDVLVLDRHGGPVHALDVRGGMLASGSGDGAVRLWDMGTGEEVRRFEGHATAITAATWSGDLRRLAVVYENRDIRLWDLVANTEEWRIEELSSSAITAISLEPGGTKLAVGFEDGIISIWNIYRSPDTGGIRQPWTFGRRHRGQRISALAWSHDGRFLASGDWRGRVFLWDLTKRNPQRNFENDIAGHLGGILSLAWSTDDKILVSASSDGSIHLCNFVDGVVQGRWLGGDTKSISSLALAADDKTVVVGTSNGTLRYWDLKSGEQRTAQRFTGRSPKVVSVSSDGRALASTDRGAQKGLLQIWIRSRNQTTYIPTYRLISGKRGTWAVCQSNKKCLRYDDGTLLALRGDQGILEPISLGAERSELKLLSAPDEVVTTDGEASSFSLRLRNLGPQVFWVNIRQAEGRAKKMSLQFYPPPTEVRIEPGGEIDLPCHVSLSSNYENSQNNTFSLRLEIVSANTAPLALEPIKIRAAMASRWGQNGGALLVEFAAHLVRKRYFILLLAFGVVAYIYRIYRPYLHLTARQVMRHPETLPSLHPDQLVWIAKTLTTKQMRRVLSSVGIRSSQFYFAVKFFDESNPDIRIRMLVETLGADEQFYERIREDLWSLPLGSEFLLNVEDVLIYLPTGTTRPEDEWNNLLKLPEVQDQITLLISPNPEHQEMFHQLANSTKNLVTAPSAGQIRDLLMWPDPERCLADLIAAQVQLYRISPYQISSGVTKESVFFGRRDIISHIMHRAPFNYFIVGGRQVGKSSLLKALDRRYQGLQEVVECHYMVLNDSELLKRLARTVGLPDASLDKTLHALSVLGKDKRRLMLIDEADEFIVEDRRNGYKILSRLRSLSEEGSCYFILAGFWDLYDAVVRDYHSPLKNFGETLTIGALEEDACRELATKPMRAMGISYSSPELVLRLITMTGRRANLLSILCNEIVKGLEPGNQIIREADIDRAIDSPALARVLDGWSSVGGDDLEGRCIDRILVLATIKEESFSLNDVLYMFQSIGFKVGPEEVERSLHRLVLAFVLSQESSLYFYQVPLLKRLITHQNPEDLLLYEIEICKEVLRSVD